MASHKEVYADWKYLFKTIGYADDMTGGYVDSEDLDELLKKPTTATAKKLLGRQIDYWFDVGIEYLEEHKGKSFNDLLEEYPKLAEIAERHCVDTENLINPFCCRYA